MALTPTTLQTLITRVRQRTNMEKNFGFVTDAEITDMLNMSLSELDDILINTWDDYKLSESQAVITTPIDGYNYFTLPADFAKVRGVDRQYNGIWVTLDNYGFAKRNQYSFPIINFLYGYLSVYYRVQGQNVTIIPAVNSQATYRIWYIPEYIPLVQTTDELQPYMDNQAWCEYGIVDCAIKIFAKQNLDATTFEGQKMALQQRIINAAKPRDAGPPKRIQNTRYERGFLGPGWNSDD